MLGWILVALAEGALLLFPSLVYLLRVFKGPAAFEDTEDDDSPRGH